MKLSGSRTWITYAVLAGFGFAVGRATAPAPVTFPDPDQGRSAEAMEADVAKALSEPRAFVRTSALVRLYQGLTSANAAGAARAVASRGGRNDPVDMQLFLGAWSLIDPEAAIQEVLRWPVKDRRGTAITTVVREWAAGGGRLAAGDFYQTTEDPETKQIAAGPLVRGWALAGDANGALDLARTIWVEYERLDVADALVRGVLDTRGPGGLFDFVRGADDHGVDAFHQRLVRVSLNLGGREDPEGAAALYDEVSAGADPDWLRGALDRVAGDWRTRDPQAALEWLLPKRDSQQRSEALTETIGTWANRDFAAAWRWLSARGISSSDTAGELDSTNTALVVGILQRTARVQPEDASKWLGRLGGSDPNRIALARRIAYFWSMRDPAAAGRWMDSLDLSPSERAAVAQSAGWGRDAARDSEAGEAQGSSAETAEPFLDPMNEEGHGPRP